MTGPAPSDIKDDDLPPAPEEGSEPEGASVELTEEEAEGLPAPEKKDEEADTGDGPKLKRRSRPRVPADRRIGQLTARASDAERTAAALKEELEQLRPKVGEYEGAALHWGKQAVEREIQLLERELKDAKDGSDTAAEAALQNKLAAAHAQLARFPQVSAPEEKPEVKQPEKKPEPKATVKEEPEIPPQLQAAPGSPKESWLGENTWFDPRSDDHDPAMASVAMRYATKLENDLKARGRPDLISSEWYFGKINAELARVFPDEYEAPAPTPPPANRGMPPMRQQNGAVSSPGRAPATRATRIDLTDEEKSFALALPRKTHADGKPYSDADMLKSYALHKANPNLGPVRVTYTGRNGG